MAPVSPHDQPWSLDFRGLAANLVARYESSNMPHLQARDNNNTALVAGVIAAVIIGTFLITGIIGWIVTRILKRARRDDVPDDQSQTTVGDEKEAASSRRILRCRLTNALRSRLSTARSPRADMAGTA